VAETCGTWESILLLNWERGKEPPEWQKRQGRTLTLVMSNWEGQLADRLYMKGEKMLRRRVKIGSVLRRGLEKGSWEKEQHRLRRSKPGVVLGKCSYYAECLLKEQVCSRYREGEKTTDAALPRFEGHESTDSV